MGPVYYGLTRERELKQLKSFVRATVRAALSASPSSGMIHCKSGSVTAQAALAMYGADRLFQAVAAHYNRDRQLAGALRDGDDVNTLAGNRREDAAGQTG